ncbi:hypothetical protein HED60_21215 [Planctomycetales bacterium ZRK34]|nr:hypothetical protein HED60_21215 [Planctomycetales bacterium ZRK34]
MMFVGLLGGTLKAQQDDAVAALRAELTAVRQELAQTQLDLQKALSDLAEVRQYLQAEDTDKQIAEWRKQRAAYEAERKQLAVERRKLDAARAALRDQSQVVQQRLRDEPPPPVTVDPNKPRWQVDYKIAVIQTGLVSESVYIDPVEGEVLLDRYPDIDRKHIMVRGTWQNRSAASWRYTFEIRIADKIGRIIGHWRYQTPVLDPNALHEFEVKVPVTDVAYIKHYQIGNIESDRPDAQQPQPQPAGQPAGQ